MNKVDVTQQSIPEQVGYFLQNFGFKRGFILLTIMHHIATSNSPKRHFFALSLQVAGYMTLAGFISFVSSQLAFNTLNRISPLSYSVVNTFKRVCFAVTAIFYLGEQQSSTLQIYPKNLTEKFDETCFFSRTGK